MSKNLKFKFQDLVDIPVLGQMLNKLYNVAGIPSAIIDMEGNVLTWSGGERICEDFYRKHPVAEKVCIQSDTKIREEISKGKPYAIYKCPHGLVDSCTPIVIEGHHIANVFTGQMLHTTLNDKIIEEHKGLARKYGFYEDDYLDALREVRVFPIEKHKDILDILSLLSGQIAKIGLTNLRALEQAKVLEESEEKYRELVEGTNDLVTVVDKQGKFTYLNHRAEEIYGMPLTRLMGESALEFIHPEDQTETRNRFKDFINRQQPVGTFENRQINQQTGKIHLMLWTSNFHYDEQGKLEYVSAIAHDITEQRQAERVLQILVESTAGSIGKSFFTNVLHKLCDLLGCDCAILGKLIGTSEIQTVAVELDGAAVENFSYELAGTPCDDVANKGFCYFPDNICELFPEDAGLTEMKAVGYIGTPVVDLSGKPVGIICAISRSRLELPNNIKPVLEILAARTGAEIERLDAESAKERAEAQLRQTHKIEAIGVLAGGIAHDFNNILAAILGNLNLALFDEDLNEKTKKLLSEAEKASLRAKDLTQQLLTFSKGGEPVKEISSLGNVIKDSANFVIQGDRVACRYDIPKDLWLVDIDRGQMSQVIQNIVLNACQAMPGGGIIKISCENVTSVSGNSLPLTKDGKFIKISIRDSGIGMPGNVLDKIFDPYFSTKQEGSGLGLAITQSIITKHNGYITLESSPGVGSTFTIYLPVSKKNKTQKKEPIAETKTNSRTKILIMDDEEMVRSVAKEMLLHLGHEVVLSRDGVEAIKLYQAAISSNEKFDLVIMDLTIPGGLGGKNAVREILNIDQAAKVIVSSGYSNDPIMANYKDYGFYSAITKPYRLQELNMVISELVD